MFRVLMLLASLGLALLALSATGAARADIIDITPAPHPAGSL
jgi:hypothetical protein